MILKAVTAEQDRGRDGTTRLGSDAIFGFGGQEVCLIQGKCSSWMPRLKVPLSYAEMDLKASLFVVVLSSPPDEGRHTALLQHLRAVAALPEYSRCFSPSSKDPFSKTCPQRNDAVEVTVLLACRENLAFAVL